MRRSGEDGIRLNSLPRDPEFRSKTCILLVRLKLNL